MSSSLNVFFFFNHTHTHTRCDTSPYSLTESRIADVFLSLVFSVPSQLHRRGDECKSMPIDYPFSSHKNCLPQSPIHPLYIPSLHMDFSSQIVLCGDTPVARWAKMCTVLLQFCGLKSNTFPINPSNRSRRCFKAQRFVVGSFSFILHGEFKSSPLDYSFPLLKSHYDNAQRTLHHLSAETSVLLWEELYSHVEEMWVQIWVKM